MVFAVGCLKMTAASGLGYDLSGIVLGTNGLPSIGATVVVSSRTRPDFSATGRTDDAGRFVFHRLDDDLYSIVVLPPIDRVLQTPIHAPMLVSSGTVDLVFSQFLSRVQLAARIVSDRDGLPTSAQMSLAPSAPHMAGLSMLMNGSTGGYRDRDETGLYRFSDIILGETYWVEIFMDGNTLPSFLVIVQDGGNATVEEYGLSVLRKHGLRVEFISVNERDSESAPSGLPVSERYGSDQDTRQ